MATSSNQASELFGQASRSFEAAIQSGLKLQEESVKCLTEMLGDLTSPQKLQKKTQSIISGVMASSQQTIDETISTMNANAKASLDLLQKAMHAKPSNPEEVQSKTVELWETALSAFRRNTEAMLKANSRVMTAWTEMAKSPNGEHVERMAEAAQKVGEAVMGSAAN